jgi:hypothetical protein
VCDYGLADRAIGVRSLAEAKEFFLYPWCPDRPGASGNQRIGGWVGFSAGLNKEVRGKLLCRFQTPFVQSVVRHYTDWASTATMNGIGLMLSRDGGIVSRSLFYEFSYSDLTVTVTQKTLCSEPAHCADTCHSCLLCLGNDIVLRCRTASLSLTCKFRWRSQSTSGNLQTLLSPIVRVSLLAVCRHSIVVILARLVTVRFMQRDGKAGIHRSENILRGGVCSTLSHCSYRS